MGKKRKKIKGTVQKIIKSLHPQQAEQAQIELHEGEHLYREIRVENVVADEQGQKARMKPGAEVDVVIEADSDSTTNKAE